jgi:hypothetical protein
MPADQKPRGDNKGADEEKDPSSVPADAPAQAEQPSGGEDGGLRALLDNVKLDNMAFSDGRSAKRKNGEKPRSGW